MDILHDEQQMKGTFHVETGENKVAKLTYVLKGPNMIIDHTIIDKSLRGKNLGIKLVNNAVEFARDNGLKIVPECSYARKILEQSDQYKDVLLTKN